MIFPVQKTPLIFPGLVCWLDADRTPTGALSSIPDFSGNGFNALQVNPVKQGVCVASQQNGRNGLVFTTTGVQNAISTFGFVTSANTTIFFVAKLNSLAVPGTNLILLDGIDSTNRQSLIDNPTSGLFTFGSNTQSNGATADLNPHIHLMQGGSTGNYYIDNVAQFTNTNLGTLGVAGLAINSRFAGTSNNANINIYEVILYNRKLSSAECLTIQQYLKNKWGIAIS